MVFNIVGPIRLLTKPDGDVTSNDAIVQNQKMDNHAVKTIENQEKLSPKENIQIDDVSLNSSNSSDSLGESEVLCPILATNNQNQNQNLKTEVHRFLKWFDTLTGKQLLFKVLPIPPNVILGFKALTFLRSEGYVLFEDNNTLYIRINGSDGIIGTLDV